MVYGTSDISGPIKIVNVDLEQIPKHLACHLDNYVAATLAARAFSRLIIRRRHFTRELVSGSSVFEAIMVAGIPSAATVLAVRSRLVMYLFPLFNESFGLGCQSVT